MSSDDPTVIDITDSPSDAMADTANTGSSFYSDEELAALIDEFPTIDIETLISLLQDHSNAGRDRVEAVRRYLCAVDSPVPIQVIKSESGNVRMKKRQKVTLRDDTDQPGASLSVISSANSRAHEFTQVTDNELVSLLQLFPDVGVDEIVKTVENVKPGPTRVQIVAKQLRGDIGTSSEFDQEKHDEVMASIKTIFRQFPIDNEHQKHAIHSHYYQRLMKTDNQLSEIAKIYAELKSPNQSFLDELESNEAKQGADDQIFNLVAEILVLFPSYDQLYLYERLTVASEQSDAVLEKDKIIKEKNDELAKKQQSLANSLAAGDGLTDFNGKNEHGITELQLSSEEYNDVFNLIVATKDRCKFKISKISKISNTILEAQFQARRRLVQGHCDGTDVENVSQMLFHSTYPASIQEIVAEGFNRSYAGKHASAWGAGCYFAKRFAYSFEYLKLPKKRYVFVCEVLTGLYCQGNPTMLVLPNVPNEAFKYHSAVDNPRNPNMYVIFHDCASVPRYLVELDCQ